jgi:hypothetical protein
MEKRKPSCEVEELVPDAEIIALAKEAKPKTHEEKEAEKLGVTLAKFKAMQEYAAQLVRQEPRMKKSRVRRKVAEKFNLKLV